MLERNDRENGRTQQPRLAGRLRARFAAHGGVTELADLYETGGLRMKFPRTGPCEAVLVNVGGGIAGGDRLDVDIALDAGAEATFTTQSAEKIYRADGEPARVATDIRVGEGAKLIWAPQETLLFEGARLERRIRVDLAAGARLVFVEGAVFGRIASGETAADAHLRDRWRIRLSGELLFAEEANIRGAADLDRPALGGGARAAATLLMIGAGARETLDPLRALFEAHDAAGVEGGASLIAGEAGPTADLLIARAVAKEPQRLRSAMREVIILATGRTPPRVWA